MNTYLDLGLIWLMMLVVGMITFAYRVSFMALLDRIRVPMLIQRALRFVPVAALTAIITPELIIRDGAVFLSPMNLRLIAGVVAIIVAWRTRNTLLTIGIGMATLWVLQLIAQFTIS
jgi:branched-subunit amino acid transport protein